jgi:large subunit ribosomal protein L17
MRHRHGMRKLNMDSSQRKATFRNMVTSLVLHERIRTTETRAKELRRYAERVITIAKRAPSADAIAQLAGAEADKAKAQRVHAFRRAARILLDGAAVDKLFADIAPRLATRAGGYTRVVKAGVRPGDNAPMAIIELVDVSTAAPSAEGVAAE